MFQFLICIFLLTFPDGFPALKMITPENYTQNNLVFYGLVPEPLKNRPNVNFGDNVVLGCIHDLPQNELYKIAWYHNGLEIYRYVPSASIRITMYPKTGIDIDVIIFAIM